MKTGTMHRTATRATHEKERAVLVGVTTRANRKIQVEEYLQELTLLAESAGAEVLHRVIQDRDRIDPAYFIGRGKAEELAWLVNDRQIDIVIFDDDLSAVQVRNLERMIRCKIVDRSGIILDIFASRARSSEAKTQVELAQLKYMLPRLTRQWTHLSKQFGGIGTKGPGETQIETDRRAIRARISHLGAKLDRIGKEREVQRKGREQFPRIALVGYTNVGKSTLMNQFSGAGVPVEDKLFATLDSTARLVQLSPAHRVLFSDTVGFIRKLPHHLVASFKSTLDEVREADILLHVVDVSHPLFEEQIQVVRETLDDIGVQAKPVIMVFNKIDRLSNRSLVTSLRTQYDHAVLISAARGINIHSLNEALIGMLDNNVAEQTIVFSREDYPLISQIYDIAEILSRTDDGDTITLRFRMNKVHTDRLLKVLGRKHSVTHGE
jgi:GTP-binding protein HflX